MPRNVLLVVVLLLLAALGKLWFFGDSVRPVALERGGWVASSVAPNGPLVPDARPLGLPGGPAPGAFAPKESDRAEELHGECLDYHSMEGVPGTVVTFQRQANVLARATSDEAGAFQASLPSGDFDEVRVEPPEGWWCVKHERKRGTYQVRLARDDVSRLHAKLVNTADGEALPEFTVKLEGPGGWNEVLTSDEEGAIRSESLFEQGTLLLYSTEEEFGPHTRPIELAQHAHVPAGADPPRVTIRIDGGMTYWIDLDNPGDVPLKRLRAGLISASFSPESRLAYERPDPTVSVRSGRLPWVRLHWKMPQRWNPYLVLEDQAGRWRGAAPITIAAGSHPTPVPIRLESRVRVSGHVRDAMGQPVGKASVELVSDEGDLDAGRFSGQASVLGLYIFEGVPPGTYTISAQEPRTGRGQRSLLVASEDLLDQDLHLEPYAVGGDLIGKVRSLSGTFQSRGQVALWSEAEGSDLPTRFATVVWTELGAAFEGTYTFEDVAGGEYLIQLVGASNFDVRPRRTTVRASGGGVDFTVRDDEPRFAVRFLLYEEETLEPILEAKVRVADAAGNVLYDGALTGYRPERCFAQGEDFSWSIEAEGYAPRTGDGAAYAGTPGGKNFFAQMRLKPLPSSD